MADETNITESEPVIEDALIDGEDQPLGNDELDKIWKQVLDSDGKIAAKQDDTPAPQALVGENAPLVGEVTTEGQVSAPEPILTDFEKRMAELETQGIAAIENSKVPVPEPVLGNTTADPVNAPVKAGETVTPLPANPVPPAPDFLDVSQAKLPRYIQVGDVLIDSKEALENLTPEAKGLFLATWQAKQQEAKPEPAIQDSDVPHGTLGETVKKLAERQDALERMNRHYEAERAVARLDPEIIKINANPPGSTQPHEFWSYLDSLSPGKRYMAENGPPEVTAEFIGHWRETVKAKAIAAANDEKAKVKTRTDNLHGQTAVASNNAPVTRNVKNMTHEEEQNVWARLTPRERDAWWKRETARMG